MGTVPSVIPAAIATAGTEETSFSGTTTKMKGCRPVMRNTQDTATDNKKGEGEIMTTNLPATTQKVASIRELLNRSRRQLEMALPKHLTADRLLRVAMTSIQRTPKLLDCTQPSLLACIMTCAQLGLEPDQFLGQAYLVPFGNVCTLIPGYRGYIALARRSGEVQSVSAQAVYAKDHFILQYGIAENLEHIPYEPSETELDTKEPRGPFKGSYVIFKYKDGSYSFDYMGKAEIDRIRKRSKAASDGPWVTDYAEMAKKTVIKRHAKLAPLSVEFQRAVALEDRAMAGESQADLLRMDTDVIEGETFPEEKPALSAACAEFDKATIDQIKTLESAKMLAKYLDVASKHFKKPVEEIKADAMKDIAGFLTAYEKWATTQAQKEALKKKATEKVPEADPLTDRFECPKGGYVMKEICRACPDKNTECP